MGKPTTPAAKGGEGKAPAEVTARQIHLEWDGPYDFNDLDKLNDPKSDYGVYQIYGAHPVYGPDVLLHLGQAVNETFSARLAPEKEEWGEVTLYVGRLAGTETPEEKEWEKQIELAEALLTYVHSPVYNSQDQDSLDYDGLRGVQLLNWYYYRDLLPEVSGARWLAEADAPSWNVYGGH